MGIVETPGGGMGYPYRNQLLHRHEVKLSVDGAIRCGAEQGA